MNIVKERPLTDIGEISVNKSINGNCEVFQNFGFEIRGTEYRVIVLNENDQEDYLYHVFPADTEGKAITKGITIIIPQEVVKKYGDDVNFILIGEAQAFFMGSLIYPKGGVA